MPPTEATEKKTEAELHWHGGCALVATPDDPVEACLAVPAVKALKRKRTLGTLAVISSEETAPIWDLVEEIDMVLPVPPKASAKKARKIIEGTGAPFDSALIFQQGNVAKAISAFNVPQRVGYATRALQPHLSNAFPEPSLLQPARHRVRYYCDLVEQLACSPYELDNFKPNGNRAATESGKALIVCVDSCFGSAGEWGIEGFEEVLRPAVGQIPMHLVTWPVMSKRVKSLASALGDEVEVLPTPNIATLLDALGSARAVIACDGVLPHLAAHVGVPVLVIFGPGSLRVHRPLGKIHTLLSTRAECSPCFLNECPFDHRCMEELEPKIVSKALSLLWAQTN